MATLAGLRTLVYAYLGTTSSDPAYPAATVNALINAAGNALIADIQQQKPDYLFNYTTITAFGPTSRTYALPSNYAGWLAVRLNPDADGGASLPELRREELERLNTEAPSVMAFSITGPDNSALLQTSMGVPLGTDLFLLYRTQPSELASDTDVPTWCPTAYHDLIARKAAIDAFGLGNESAPSPLFVAATEDREAQLWASIGRRGSAPTIQR